MVSKIRRIGYTLAIVTALVGMVFTPAQAAAEVIRFSYSGLGATADWTTCPNWPTPAGTVCTETFVTVVERVYAEDGTAYPSSMVYFYQGTYEIDDNGYYQFVEDVVGSAAVNFSIDRKLSAASVSADVPVEVCTIDDLGDYTCESGGIIPVSVTWTSNGDITRTNGSYHTISKSFTYNSLFRGLFRFANASAVINGSDPGTLEYAEMFNSRSSYIYIDR